jgi:hypothetical protein
VRPQGFDGAVVERDRPSTGLRLRRRQHELARDRYELLKDRDGAMLKVEAPAKSDCFAAPAAGHGEQAPNLYLDALERRAAILEEWQLRDEPLMSEGSKGQWIEHPSIKMLREHDELCSRLAVPGVRRPKSSKLRSVK